MIFRRFQLLAVALNVCCFYHRLVNFPLYCTDALKYYTCYISVAVVVYCIGCKKIISSTWPGPETDGPSFKSNG